MTRVSVMNNTKWEELRVAMYGLGEFRPMWRTFDINGYLSSWDTEWFYHFRQGDYASIDWLELRLNCSEQEAAVLTALKKIHIPGMRIMYGYRIYGYSEVGKELYYI